MKSFFRRLHQRFFPARYWTIVVHYDNGEFTVWESGTTSFGLVLRHTPRIGENLGDRTVVQWTARQGRGLKQTLPDLKQP